MAVDGEIARILEVPRIPAEAYRDRGAALRDRLTRPGTPARFMPDQETALGAIAVHRSGILQIACGGGKGLITMLAAAAAGGFSRPLLLIPPKLRGTFGDEWAKYHALGFRLPEGLEVRPHSWLSRRDAGDALADLSPDLIVIDEAHAFKRASSARTRRLLRYLDAEGTIPNGGRVGLICASGTLTTSSVLDFAHLAWHALGPRSPLPRVGEGGEPSAMLRRWAQVLDVGTRPEPGDLAAVSPLVEAFAPEHLDEWRTGRPARLTWIAREAFKRRRTTTPGLISTADTEDAVGASLVIYARQGPAPPPEIVEALDRWRAGETPDGGDAYASDLEAYRAGAEISAGYYRRWAWERVREDGSPDPVWIDARKRWARAVRQELQDRPGPGYDSPGNVWLRVVEDVERLRDGGTPRLQRLHARWASWALVRDRYRVQDLRDHVWISPWFLDDLAAFVRRMRAPVVIWYASAPVAEGLAARGFPVYGAGQEAPRDGQTCALSLHVHHEGVTHLQTLYNKAVFAEMPSSADVLEQAIARLHRAGQRADTVETWIPQHTEATRRALRSAREKAAYMNQGQGRQRLLSVPIVPVP